MSFTSPSHREDAEGEDDELRSPVQRLECHVADSPGVREVPAPRCPPEVGDESGQRERLVTVRSAQLRASGSWASRPVLRPRS
jgi:hypothetical protein